MDVAVLVDRKRLDDALDAILDNAVKATSAGDTIAIEGHAEDGIARIDVSDWLRNRARLAAENFDRSGRG